MGKRNPKGSDYSISVDDQLTLSEGEVQALTDDLIPLLDAFLRRDVFLNAYAIWDLYHMRHRTRFFICRDREQIKGVLLGFLGRLSAFTLFGSGERTKSLESFLTS